MFNLTLLHCLPVARKKNSAMGIKSYSWWIIIAWPAALFYKKGLYNSLVLFLQIVPCMLPLK
jgi:hypothetical protein